VNKQGTATKESSTKETIIAPTIPQRDGMDDYNDVYFEFINGFFLYF
jgi:hypothetical protein